MKVGVVGVGLIGGSMALKLKSENFTDYVLGMDADENALKQALELGIIDEQDTLESGIQKVDLLILAIPVDASKRILANILDALKPHQTIIDVGSTKFPITEAVKNHPNRKRYVAFHPMWGTENSGPAAATVNSFSGKTAVICNKEESAMEAIELTQSLIEALGMQVVYMNAKDHDIHTAYISHISHITSYALANTVLEKEKFEETIFQLASSGFSSTVRLAKSHPEMWVPIFQQNRDNILDVLKEHILQLQHFQAALENEDEQYLENLILNANRIRAILKE